MVITFNFVFGGYFQCFYPILLSNIKLGFSGMTGKTSSMNIGEATIIAAGISTLVGGLIAILSSYLSTRQSQKYQVEQFKQEIYRDHLLALLPLRQKALEVVWISLIQLMLGNDLSESQRDKYLSLTVWLPSTLRTQCIEALSHTDDKEFLRKAQAEIISYIQSLESSEYKSLTTKKGIK